MRLIPRPLPDATGYLGFGINRRRSSQSRANVIRTAKRNPESIQTMPSGPPTQFTREELHERVWAEPMRTVAQRLGISDVGLAKQCRRMRVPVPGRGYWAKKAAGQKLRKLPLPPLPPNDSATPRTTVIHAAPSIAELPPLPAPIAEQTAFEANPENAIRVANALRSPHVLVRATMEALDGKGKQDSDFLSNWQVRHLDIEVTKGALHRALRVADAMVKAFERRGWSVSIGSPTDRDDRKTWVAVLGQTIPISIREPLKKVLNEPAKPQRLSSGRWYTPYQSKYREEPSGKLALVIRNSWGHSVSRNWPDTPAETVEDRLNDFTIAIVAEAHALNERAARFAEKERERRAAEDLRFAEQRRREAELAKRRAFDDQAKQWEKSQLLRDYLRALQVCAERQAAASGEMDAELSAWLIWADEYVLASRPLERPLLSLSRERATGTP
jgi:hypothetical protein